VAKNPAFVALRLPQFSFKLANHFRVAIVQLRLVDADR
jgi:hypothetical protein